MAGEARGCSAEALLMIADLHQRNPHMNGWRSPNASEVWLAMFADVATPPVRGVSRFVFSDDDLRLPAVRAIVGGQDALRRFECGKTFFGVAWGNDGRRHFVAE